MYMYIPVNWHEMLYAEGYVDVNILVLNQCLHVTNWENGPPWWDTTRILARAGNLGGIPVLILQGKAQDSIIQSQLYIALAAHK